MSETVGPRQVPGWRRWPVGQMPLSSLTKARNALLWSFCWIAAVNPQVLRRCQTTVCVYLVACNLFRAMHVRIGRGSRGL